MLRFRPATADDCKLFFDWANDKTVRQNSFETDEIPYSSHVSWFNRKVSAENSLILVFELENEPVGQVRVDGLDDPNGAVIGVSVDEKFRGKGYAAEMIRTATEEALKKIKTSVIAFVKPENQSSLKAFIKAGYSLVGEAQIKNQTCLKLIKK